MSASNDDLGKLVNRSGFLFQLAVEEDVRQSASKHEWEVFAREYPWRTRDHSRGGFIDFIAGRSALRAVFECKRTQRGEWIFLVPEPGMETPSLRALWAFLTRDGAVALGWDDFLVDPVGFTSEFCIVRGGSDDDRPMLERVAGDLVRASESLAREELAMAERHRGQAMYIPIIVTNATLYACRVAVGDVDLSTGALPASAKFEEIGAIRFRKALASDVEHEPNTYESFRRRDWCLRNGVRW